MCMTRLWPGRPSCTRRSEACVLRSRRTCVDRIYVCVYVNIYIYIYIYTHVYIYVYNVYA